MSVFTKPPVPSFQYGDQTLDRCPRLRNVDESFGGSSLNQYQSYKRPRIYEIERNQRMPKFNNMSRAGIPCKTEPCGDFRNGCCGYGNNCRYSHEFRGISKLESHREETVSKVGVNFRYNSLCNWVSSGMECPYGTRCRFSHEVVTKNVGDVGLCKKSADTSIVVVNGRNETSVASAEKLERPGDSNVSALYWKTRLCNKWQASNDCPYGSKCSYAHAEAELLPRPYSSYRNLSSSSFAGLPKDEASNTKETGDVQKKQGKGIRWKTVNKLIGIYADWIEDMPPEPDI